MEEKIEMYITEKAAQEEATEKSYNERIMEVKKMKYEKKAFDKLMELGVPANLLGYSYLKYAIAAAVEDESLIHNMTKILYPKIAEHFGTTASRAERAIRHAIEVSFSRANNDALLSLFGYTISAYKGKATNSEFIVNIAERIRIEESEEA